MRFNILSLGLVATVFMSASVRAIPVGNALDGVSDDVGNVSVVDAAGNLGDGGALDAAADAAKKATGILPGNIGDDLGGAIDRVVANSNPATTALKKRSLILSRRQLFQRRAETAATDATAAVNDAAQGAGRDTAASVAPVGGENEEEPDEEEPEEEEEELTRRSPDGDVTEKEEIFVRRLNSEDEKEEDEEEEDEDDKGKRKRSVTGEPDEEEADEQEPEEEEPEENEIEPEENEIEPEENEVEPDEEEADELGDAEPAAGRR